MSQPIHNQKGTKEKSGKCQGVLLYYHGRCAISVPQVRCSKKEKRTNVSLVPVFQSIAATDAGVACGVTVATHAIGIDRACLCVGARRARRSSTIDVRFIGVCYTVAATSTNTLGTGG